MEIHELTMTDITEAYVEMIRAAHAGISKRAARQLFFNAFAYNVVSEAIMEQIDFIIEKVQREDGAKGS